MDPKKGLSCGMMQESIHQYVVDQLAEVKGSWPVVARNTGMSLRTIEKIARREIQDPGVSSIEKLAAYFRTQPKQSSGDHASGSAPVRTANFT